MVTTSDNVLIKNLIEFGLGEKEARAYLALLELEVATVTEIAKKTNINRSSTYVVLSSLKRKGLVSTSEDKKIQSYSAITPEMLFYEARNKAQRAEDVKSKISDIVPELKALHKDTKQRPKVKVFEGIQGLINAFEETLNNKEKLMRVSSSVEDMFKVLPNYFPDYVKRRINLGIKMYGIHPNEPMVQNLINSMPKFDKPILIPKNKYNFSADIAIYDNKIGYMSTKESLAILIESQEIADVMKSIFDLAYEEAKRLSKIKELIGQYKESLSKYALKKQ